jgi:hypothetical protein
MAAKKIIRLSQSRAVVRRCGKSTNHGERGRGREREREREREKERRERERES